LTKRALDLGRNELLDGEEEQLSKAGESRSVFSHSTRNSISATQSINSVYMRRRIAAAKKNGFPEFEGQLSYDPRATNGQA
jgi:hypothetical protein